MNIILENKILKEKLPKTEKKTAQSIQRKSLNRDIITEKVKELYSKKLGKVFSKASTALSSLPTLSTFSADNIAKFKVVSKKKNISRDTLNIHAFKTSNKKVKKERKTAAAQIQKTHRIKKSGKWCLKI